MPAYAQLKSTTPGALDSVRFGAPATCAVAPTTDDHLANKKYVDDSVDAIDVTNSTHSQPIMQILLTANASNKNNTALGQNSLTNYNSNDIGPNNTAVGVNSLGSNTSGRDNTSIGTLSLSSNISGENNTAIGYNALTTSTNSHHNTAVGKNSLNSLINGAHFNTAIGYDSGGNIATWNNSAYGNTFLGAATYMTGNFTYSTAVGAETAITKSYQIVLGTSSQTVTIPKFTTAGVVHNLANGDLTSSLIVTADISNNAITTAKIADSNVTTAKIATGAITSEKILDGTIVGADISSNTITADNIANGTITSFKIATGTIVGSNIAESTITSEKILNGTILGSDISSNTITADNIANGTITADKLATSLALSGNPTAPTPDTSDNSINIATTAFVKNQSYLTESSASSTYLTQTSASSTYLTQSSASSTYAPLASPVFTGNPTAPTPDTSDNDTTVATTAFVKNQNYITSSSLGVMNLSAPASPVDGSFYFEPSNGNFRIYHNGAWKDFAQVA
jgi:hypothetical protein